MNNPIGTIYDSSHQTVIVHDGSRGPRGLPGEEGEQGPQGPGITIRGEWQSGFVYGPGDAVTWRSVAVDGVDSLYIQIDAWPEEISTIPPNEDPARWVDIGATTLAGAFGSIWNVTQPGHGFQYVGTPLSLTASGYQLANASSDTTLGIAVIREIVSNDELILQSTGGIEGVAPQVFLTPPVAGVLYYVSTSSGRLSTSPPVTGYSNPILQLGTDTLSGVVLPWRPVESIHTNTLVPSTVEKFYYTATAGQTVFTGPDDNAQTPDYTGANVEVFQQGLNLIETAQYSNDASSVTLVTPAQAGDVLEIWSAVPVTPSLSARDKADKLTFDGVTTDFPLTVIAVAIPFTNSVQFDVYLDGNPQEPGVDFTVVDSGGDAVISFTVAPETETENWIVHTKLET